LNKQFELARLDDDALSGVWGGYGGGDGWGDGEGGGEYESNSGFGGLAGIGGVDLNVLGIADQ